MPRGLDGDQGSEILFLTCCALRVREERCAQACYAMGYNLAIEYLADYEKTWMLDSFRSLNQRVLQPQSRPLTEWLFLEVSTCVHPIARGLSYSLVFARQFHQAHSLKVAEKNCTRGSMSE